MTTNAKRLLIAIVMAMAAIGFGEVVYAQAPHDSSRGVTCSSASGGCHTRGGFKTRSSFDNLCFNTLIGCHRASPGIASKKRLSMLDASDRFGNISVTQKNAGVNLNDRKQSSHGWKIPNVNSNAGVTTNRMLKETPRAPVDVKIFCTRCHRVMGYFYPKFLRASPTGNYICFNCHASRRIDNVRDPLPSSVTFEGVEGAISVAPHYSHPVEVNYSTARQKAAERWGTDFFEATPQLASVFGYNTSASVRLYTTHNTAAGPYGGSSRLAGTNKGAVVCQSCHGPIHSADSNPYTFDNLSAYSRLGKYSSSAGNLLRMYPIAGPRASDNLCKSCHKVKVHETNYPGLPANYFSCGRCHTPHKKPGEANRYLILENISTPFNGIRPVYFVSTSAMAKRYGAGTENSSTNKSLLGGYSTSASRLNKDRTVSSAICQVCHTRTKYQRNYSSRYNTRRGGTGTGHDLVYNDATGKFRFCPECHVHTSAFKPAGAAACSSCHVAPPYDTYSGGLSTRVIGRHAKHVKYKNGDDTNASYSWDGGTLSDDRQPDAYGFSCGRCHSPYANYSDSQHKRSTFDDPVFSINTADVGFVRAANEKLPQNPGATYVYQNRGVGDWGANNLGSKWSTPDVGGYGTCYNLYCHGQFYNGYTSNNPKFTGTQPCGSCHGAKRSDPPGKTNNVNYGAHPRHVGNANNQQYNSNGWKFGCSACHYGTVASSITSIDDRSTHVNGRVNVDFNGGGYGNAASTYGGFAGYTSRTPNMNRPAYNTCGLIYCHSDGSRTQGNYSVPFNAEQGSGTTKFPNWSSSSRGNFTTTQTINSKTFKRRCSRCHGNATYAGITAAMPGYATRAGKGNSHETHIKNGFLCNVCHGTTVNADNKSIASTTNHVNAFYNISIISRHKTGQTGYSSTVSAKKTCKNVKCHAGKTTPLWGSTARCQDCHLSSTGDTDKRIVARSRFTGFTSAAPKIYSTQWANVGHGKASSGNYTSSRAVPDRNPGANRVCSDCHRASVSHGTAANPFRLLTAPDRPNMVCERCHGVGGSGALRTGIQTHASSITATGRHNFAIKCIDCHDPHGDNNRFMLHSTLPAPNNPERRSVGSGRYGIVTSISINRNVDFVNDQYTSSYAKKFQADKVCQDCHRRTYDPADSSKKRFRYYSSNDTAHGGAKCVNCHTHASGFKGAGCNYCHGAPPTGLQNILSGAGRINPTKKRASGSTTAGAHFRHYTIFTYFQGNSLSVTCSKCHQGGMYNSGSENVDINLGFKAFGDYTGSSQKYKGQTAVSSGYYGYTGAGADTADDSLRCSVKCHGGGNWLTASYGTPTAPKWDVPNTARCGKCHGVKKAAGQGSWPMSNRHAKHAGTSGTGYDFMCRLCHADTVMGTATTLNRTNHVNGEATFKFYTGTFTGNRVWSGSTYTGGDVKVNSGFGVCQNLYCHSRGTKILQPYTGTAFPNYTARWDRNIDSWNAGEKCSFCHGSRKTAGGYAGITSAMPNQANQAHKKHVVDNGFKCYFCHSATVDINNAIVSTTNHVNRFKNVTIIATYKTGQTMYSSSLSSTNKSCKNIRCHAGRNTPNWTVSYDSIKCTDCHYSNTSDTDNFAWTNFSGNNSVAARIYSTEWTKRGHGKSKTSGKYPFSNNTGAQKNCTNCHKPAVKHGDANYFRLYTSNSDSLCMSCHGRGNQLNAWSQGYSDITGIQSHTWNNISTNGYNGGAIKAASRGGWNFTPKCVDCHDPHGDKNNYMVHSYINMSGSDSLGRPTATQPMDTNLMNFTAVGGPQVNWSSYVRSDFKGLCQRCHSNMMSGTTSIMTNFNKNLYSGHNRGKRCTDCHKHKKGFAPAGCDSCHDYPPPKAPLNFGWTNSADDMSNMSSLHIPHAWNRKQRPGITAENDVDSAGGKPSTERGYKCWRCHDGAVDSNGQSPTHATGASGGKFNASMKNLTMLNGDWSPGAFKGVTSVTDDTCSNVRCHTPRYYTRQWKKPTGCGDCHGYRNKTAGETFKIQTTGSHKTHINYSTPVIAGTDSKKYGFRCTMCHVNNANNYSTHYTGKVNMNFRFGLSTAAVYNRLANTTSFKGFTTTGGEMATCSKVYCHGRFSGGTTITQPKWGNKFTGCSNCHKSKANATNMPGAHPLHVRTVGANGYEFVCSRCHARTVVQNTISTLMWNYSSHVNKRKDIYFDAFNNNDGGTLDSTKKCKNTYCHSSGFRSSPAGSFTTRTTLSNWTANWGDGDRTAKTGNRPCSYCHGNKTYNGITAAMPNYTSSWGNSHRTHVIGNKFRCFICHAATVNNAGAISSTNNHVNGFKNITIIATYKQGQTLYSSQVPSVNKSCKNVKCHAGKTTPKWGTYIRCQDCHLSNTGDTDKRISANNIFQYYTAKTGATAPRIYSTAWVKTGHGRQIAYSSGNLAASKTCTNCHKASVAHGTPGNPFRLYTINSSGGNPNTLCEDCHGTAPGNSGKAVGSRALGIQTHASSVTKTGRHNFSIKCVDCHDPHGDNNTRFMVHSTVVRPRITGTRAEISNANGSIFLSATGRNVDFNQSLYTSDYAKKVTAAKICQVCHTRTFKPNSSGFVTRFRWNGSNDNSHGAGKCTNCHSHTQGFKGAACNSCHGFPPASANTLIGRPGTNQAKTMSGSTTAGAHLKHVNVYGSSNDTCNKCHSGGMAFDSNENDDITLKFDAFSRYTGVNQKYQGQSAVRNGFYGYSGDGIGTNNDQTCSNMKCHGAKGSWLTKSFGTPSAPVWNQAGSVFCGSCHGAKRATGQDSWPTTKGHARHVGTGAGQYDFMCRLCHSATVLGSATTLNDSTHVSAESVVELYTGVSEKRTPGGSYDGSASVNSGFGKCSDTYCHSRGNRRTGWVGQGDAAPNYLANWTAVRGGYKKAYSTLARCNFCHGNTMSGVTAAMPDYTDGTPKANKHSKHVKEYGFTCTACHMKVTRNNTSIDAPGGAGLNALHVNRVYNINFTTVVRGGSSINNSLGRYTSVNSGCRGTYCHSNGTNFVSYVIPNYTAHWGDNRLGYKQPKANMAKCNYCHGSRNAYSGMTSAMPNYANSGTKANRHPMHVTTYGFTCTVCHDRVTANSTSIDASGGSDRHVNKIYNVDFNKDVPGRSFINNSGAYTYDSVAPGSKCKNTYCHSRGADFVPPYNTRTSFANWTARWGDDRGGYKQANGLKAKCNYCHGNRLFSGITSAMPNYSTEKAKNNTHPIHVRSYGFTCNICHVKVAANNTSISDSSLHVNQAYNVNFKANVRGNLTNNTGVYSYTDLTTKNKCKNTYCHSRGTDITKPFNTRTSFANWTARWGDARGTGSYKQPKGDKAKCNYCHGNRAYSGTTSAMPNYSGNYSGTPAGVTAKANSHRVHVVMNGFVCSTCHNSIAMNNTSISDRTRHVNGFYNISITPARRKPGGQKVYSMVYNGAGGTCMNNTCHGDSKPQWGNPNSANCKACHFNGTKDTDDYARANNNNKAEIYSSEWRRKGHGQFAPFTSGNINRCERCHKPGVSHNYAQSPISNPFRLWTSVPDKLCAGCHGSTTERNASWNATATNVDYITHSRAATGGDASWNTHSSVSGKGPKCIDCHDPHGDKNRKMIHSYLNHSGSDRFGRPAGRTWGDGNINYTTAAMMTFTTWGNAQPIWSSFANNNVNRSICRRCHTPKANDGNMGNNPSPNYGEMTKAIYAVDHQTHGATCTASCHKHTSGFKGAGESSGDQECKGCHAPLYNAMTSQVNNNMPAYHHVLANTNATYSNVTLFTGGAARNSARRCLMCHVDHNRFRSDAPYNKTRSKNLRPTASTTGNYTTGINTDFWPAKRNTGRPDGTANYQATSPVTGPAGMFGVCASCHKNAQSKNTTFQTNDQGEKATPVFGTANFIAIYTSSSHNFQIISGMSRFFTDQSKFRANCSKCHGSPEYAIQNPQGKGQTGAPEKFGLHDSRYQSLNRPLNNMTTMPNPLSKQLCFKCHSQDTSNGARGSYDYYSSVAMNSGAKMIMNAVEAKSVSNHPIGAVATHRPDEYLRAAPGWNTGANMHVECVDCHNTHGGNASVTRQIGGPNGNRIAGAQVGVWGITTSGSFPATGGQPSYQKVPTVTFQWQVCAKCHTRFGWGLATSVYGSAYPVPSGGFGAPNYVNDIYLTDVLKEFNPKNYGYHPVIKKGKNQPAVGANTNWPAPTGAAAIIRWADGYNGYSGFAGMSGLDWAMIPPFNRKSTLACSDCHQADTTGLAIASYLTSNIVSTGTWSAATVTVPNLKDADGVTANSIAGTTTDMEVGLSGSLSAAPTAVNLAVWARQTRTNGTANLTYTVVKGASTSITGSIAVAKDTGAIKKYTVDIKTGLETAAYCNGTVTDACLDATTVRLAEAETYIFYVDKVAIEATFTITEAIRGPHGSMKKWILTSANKQLKVDWNDNGSYADSGDEPNATVADGTVEENILCFNCHRRAVYNHGGVGIAPAYADPMNANKDTTKYSRFNHYQVNNGGGPSAYTAPDLGNAWNIPCMACHGGLGTGKIHGDWRTQAVYPEGITVPANQTNYRPISVRLLQGAQAHLTPVINSPSANGTGTCYTHGDGTALAACTQHASAQTLASSDMYNYSYTDYTP